MFVNVSWSENTEIQRMHLTATQSSSQGHQFITWQKPWPLAVTSHSIPRSTSGCVRQCWFSNLDLNVPQRCNHPHHPHPQSVNLTGALCAWPPAHWAFTGRRPFPSPPAMVKESWEDEIRGEGFLEVLRSQCPFYGFTLFSLIDLMGAVHRETERNQYRSRFLAVACS